MEDSTLDEVLAFLDAFEAEEEQPETKKKLETSTSVHGGSEAKRRRVETKYTTQLQRRKRAEIVGLREQAGTLETRLKQLQRRTLPSEGSAFGEKKAWAWLEEKAATELEARREAERENRKLWSRLERQMKLRKDIDRLIDKYQQHEVAIDAGRRLAASTKRCSVAGMITLVSAMATLVPTENFLARESVTAVLEQLVNRVDCVFACLSSRSQSCWLETIEVGSTKEIWSSTTADCSVFTAAEALWCNPDRIPYCVPLGVDAIYVDDDCYSFEQAILPIQCQPWGNRTTESRALIEMAVHVEHYSRRVYDHDTGRVVLVMLALIRLPGKYDDVLLCEHFWRSITPIGNPQSTRSITQTSYRIEAGNGHSSQLSPAQTNIMTALTRLSRRHHAAYQDWLMERSLS